MQIIPIIAKKRDVIALAETGSGKSLSFILPILSKIDPEKDGVQAIILAPTRELLIQLYKQFLVFNPQPKKIKVKFLRKKLIPRDNSEVDGFVKNCKVLLSTPLRLDKVLKEIDMKFSTVKFLVIDEADALFDMGFISQIDRIIKTCTNTHLQKSFFSATMQPAIEELLKENMNDPIKITVGIKNATTSSIDQQLVYCGSEEGKIYAFRNIGKFYHQTLYKFFYSLSL
jgi:ATP-dependent RNA helicase DDX52/ROK1